MEYEMKSVLKKLLWAKLAVLLFTIPSWAGQEGHGGGAMACSYLKKPEFTVEFLDVWEAKNLPYYKRNMLKGTDENELLEAALIKLARADKKVAEDVAEGIQYIKQNMWPIDSGNEEYRMEINPPSDAKAKFKPANCRIEGLALFDDNAQLVFYSAYLLGHMRKSAIDMAALYLHEGMLYTLRTKYRWNEDSTAKVRELVGCLLSSDDCLPALPARSGIPTDQPVYKCVGQNVEFYNYMNGTQEYFQFTAAGRPLNSLSTIVSKAGSGGEAKINLNEMLQSRDQGKGFPNISSIGELYANTPRYIRTILYQYGFLISGQVFARTEASQANNQERQLKEIIFNGDFPFGNVPVQCQRVK